VVLNVHRNRKAYYQGRDIYIYIYNVKWPSPYYMRSYTGAVPLLDHVLVMVLYIRINRMAYQGGAKGSACKEREGRSTRAHTHTHTHTKQQQQQQQTFFSDHCGSNLLQQKTTTHFLADAELCYKWLIYNPHQPHTFFQKFMLLSWKQFTIYIIYKN